MACQDLDSHQEINIVDDFVCTDAGCPYIYLRIHNATSYKKCAGKIQVIIPATKISLYYFLYYILYKFSFFYLHFTYFTLQK